MQFGVQIVSFTVIACIWIEFHRMRTLPILSSKWYERFVNAALMNLVCEAFSLYTLYHIDSVSEELNRLAHQLHMGSLLLAMHTYMMFIEIKGRNQKRYNLKELIVRYLLALAAVPVILFSDIDYYVDGMARYSYGPMVQGSIIIVVLYLIIDFVLIYRFRKVFSQRDKVTFLFALGSWVVIAAIQILVPTMLLSSMGLALMAMNVFMNFENPREYEDNEIPQALNKRAFLVMVNEYIERKKDFYIVSMTLTNSQILKEANGYHATVRYIEEAAKHLQKYAPKEIIYHPERDSVSILFLDENRYNAFISEQRGRIGATNKAGCETAKYFINILKCPEYADSVDNIVGVMDYVDKIKADFTEPIVQIDAKILDKKNHLRQVEKLVQKAIDNEGFEVYYQPIYSNKEKRFVSAEALVRLKDTKTLGYISPEVFIPITEENGMISELGNIVFKKVCKFISESNLMQYGIQYIEVNLSGAQFMDNKLNEILTSYVEEYNVPPEFFNLEITETASIEMGDMLDYNMKRLRECSFHFSMDDYGTGYSNLSKMAEAEFDLIKLDKTLIWPCFGENARPESKVILDSSIRMIQELGKQIVAEGVETKEMVDYLTERGVCYLQGYYFAKPLPADEYLEFMKSNT